MYHQVDHLKIIISAQMVYLCVMYGSQKKKSNNFPIQHLLTGFYNRHSVYCAVGSKSLNIIQVSFIYLSF